jgi:RHS repeat-associated protein
MWVTVAQAQYFDAETGLHYNGARYYDPKVGRYLSSDPVGVVPGVSDSPMVPHHITQYFRSLPHNEVLLDGLNHPYNYVDNNPLRWIDPTGLDKTIWNNTSGGRSRWKGPTNGNWGGGCWSGGKYSCGDNPPGYAPPTDSGDQCYQRHDDCYAKCGANVICIAVCNKQLVKELKNLPDDSGSWPNPPKPGTEGDSEKYRWGQFNGSRSEGISAYRVVDKLCAGCATNMGCLFVFDDAAFLFPHAMCFGDNQFPFGIVALNRNAVHMAHGASCSLRSDYWSVVANLMVCGFFNMEH